MLSLLVGFHQIVCASLDHQVCHKCMSYTGHENVAVGCLVTDAGDE